MGRVWKNKPKDYSKKYYEKNKETYLREAPSRRRWTKYRMTEKQYKDLIKSQGNKCAICQNEFSNKRPNDPCVDHDHTTGKVRGILCRRCNVAFGMFRNSPFILKQAFDYSMKG